MADHVKLRDVWKKGDLAVREDAIALGKSLPNHPADIPLEAWGKDLCVVAYVDEKLVATAAVEVRFARLVRENMAFFRVFIAPNFRRSGIRRPLTTKTFGVVRDYALQNPGLRIGGMMAVVTNRELMDRPVTQTNQMVLIGYTPRNDKICVRWFDHIRLDTADSPGKNSVTGAERAI